MNRDELTAKIRSAESEARFSHTCSMAEMAVSLAGHHGADKDLVWMTAMLHDIAKDMNVDEMKAAAEKYGHTISAFSLYHPENMHAEVGALIAEHEYGLKDRDALRAIRHHVSSRPDMSVIEKIIYFSDFAEPSRPNYDMMQYLYRIAETNLDLAILRALRVILEYQETHPLPRDILELSTIAYDFLLEERTRKKAAGTDGCDEMKGAETLTDAEFSDALEVLRRNSLHLRSVKNIRCFGGFTAYGGRTVQSGRIFRSGALSKLSEEDADCLKERTGLSLIIDLRTPQEIKKAPDVRIPGVRYVNIPLTEELHLERLDALSELYRVSETDSERAWYLAEFSRTTDVRQMYYHISVDESSCEAIRKIFRLILEEEGTVLFHCTSGKDRTGIIAAIFLYALGCVKEDIITDYNASALVYMSLVETMQQDLKEHNYGTALQADVQKILGVTPEVIKCGLYYIDNNKELDRDIFTGSDRPEQLLAAGAQE